MALPLLCLFGCGPAPVLPSLIYSDPLDIGGAYLNDGLYRTSITGKNVVEGNKQSSGQSLGVAIPTWHVLDDFSVKVAIGSFEDDPIIVEGIGEINADNCRDYRFFIQGHAHISALNNSRPGPLVGQVEIDLQPLFDGSGYFLSSAYMADGVHRKIFETEFLLPIDYETLIDDSFERASGLDISLCCYDEDIRYPVDCFGLIGLRTRFSEEGIRFVDGAVVSDVLPNPDHSPYLVIPGAKERLAQPASDSILLSINKDGLIRNSLDADIAVAMAKRVEENDSVTLNLSLPRSDYVEYDRVFNDDKTHVGEVIRYRYRVSANESQLADYPVDDFLDCYSRDNVLDANLQPNRAYRKSDAIEISVGDLKEEGEIAIAVDYEAHYDLNSTVIEREDGDMAVVRKDWFFSDYEPNWSKPEVRPIQGVGLTIHYEKKDGYCYFSYSGDFDEEEGNNAHWFVDPDLPLY